MFEACYYEKYPDSPSNILIRDLINAHQRGIKVEVILENQLLHEINCIVFSLKGKYCLYDYPVFPQ